MIVDSQRVYWGHVTAAGAFLSQLGPGALTVGLVANVYTITMPANFTVPIDRRMVKVTVKATILRYVMYDEDASLNNTVVFNAIEPDNDQTTIPFLFEIWRTSQVIGPNQG